MTDSPTVRERCMADLQNPDVLNQLYNLVVILALGDTKVAGADQYGVILVVNNRTQLGKAMNRRLLPAFRFEALEAIADGIYIVSIVRRPTLQNDLDQHNADAAALLRETTGPVIVVNDYEEVTQFAVAEIVDFFHLASGNDDVNERLMSMYSQIVQAPIFRGIA